MCDCEDGGCGVAGFYGGVIGVGRAREGCGAPL